MRRSSETARPWAAGESRAAAWDYTASGKLETGRTPVRASVKQVGQSFVSLCGSNVTIMLLVDISPHIQPSYLTCIPWATNLRYAPVLQEGMASSPKGSVHSLARQRGICKTYRYPKNLRCLKDLNLKTPSTLATSSAYTCRGAWPSQNCRK